MNKGSNILHMVIIQFIILSQMIFVCLHPLLLWFFEFFNNADNSDFIDSLVVRYSINAPSSNILIDYSDINWWNDKAAWFTMNHFFVYFCIIAKVTNIESLSRCATPVCSKMFKYLSLSVHPNKIELRVFLRPSTHH